MKCILSVDVEAWFHILDISGAPEIDDWDSLPLHIERNFEKLLDIFSVNKVRATCFFLGWLAERYPALIQSAQACGHEIASHSYAHKLTYQMGPDEFFADTVRAREVIEDIAGNRVKGFRNAGFSVTESTPWYFDKVGEAGYTYDSSVFPARREHGGLKTEHYIPYRVNTPTGDIIEFPITVKEIFGRPLCFFGGGYLRLFPYWLIKRMANAVLAEGRPVIFYIHPREIDPSHPRLPMNIKRRFKSYVGLRTTARKVSKLCNDFEFITFADFIETYGDDALE